MYDLGSGSSCSLLGTTRSLSDRFFGNKAGCTSMPIVSCFGLAVLFQLLTVAGIETSKRNQRRQPVHADPGIRFVTTAGAPTVSSLRKSENRLYGSPQLVRNFRSGRTGFSVSSENRKLPALLGLCIAAIRIRCCAGSGSEMNQIVS